MRGRNRSRWLPWLLLLLIAATIVALVMLGNWQLRRLDWKLELIARVESRIDAEPVAAPARSEWDTIDRRKHEYLKVSVDGRLLHDRETLVQALTELGGGYWVMTPLQTPDGELIMINRGFLAADAGERWLGIEKAGGAQRITGLLRLSETEGIPFRANDPAAGRWYSRDLKAIAEAKGLGRIAPFFIDADDSPNPGGLPIGGLTRTRFRNAHLVYALTWYGLALLLAGMTVYAVRRERSSGTDSNGTGGKA